MTTGRKACLAGVVAAALLGALELAARLLPAPATPALSDLAFAQAEGGDLYASDPDLGWRLKPGLAVTFSGTHVRTNSLGLRGPEPRSPSILCVGDSVAFGYLVEEGEAWPAVLGGQLGQETLLAGVPGYSSHQGRILLAGLLARFTPRVVVLSFGYNDGVAFPLADARGGRGSWLGRQLRRSALARRLAGWFGEGRRLARALSVLTQRAQDIAAFPPADALAARRFHDGEARIRAMLGSARERVPLDDYSDNLREMVRMVRARGAIPVLLAPPFANASREPYFAASLHRSPVAAYRRAMQAVAREEDVAYVRVPPLEERPDEPRRALFVTRPLSPAEREGYRLIGLQKSDFNQLGIDPLLHARTNLAHPSAQGHALIAAAMADQLRNGLGRGLQPREK